MSKCFFMVGIVKIETMFLPVVFIRVILKRVHTFDVMGKRNEKKRNM